MVKVLDITSKILVYSRSISIVFVGRHTGGLLTVTVFDVR